MTNRYYDLNTYKKYKKYTNEEMSNLFVSFFAGDKSVRDEIVIGNLYIISLVIKKTISDLSKICFDDLFSIGEIGLMKAVDSYNVSSKVLFHTYAYACIRNEIIDYLRKKQNYESLTLQDDYEYKYNHSVGYCSDSYFDYIEEDDYVEDVYDDKDLLNKLYLSINGLDPNSRMAIALYYGFYGLDEHTVKEVAKVMNITYGEARGLINRSSIKIRKNLKNEGYNSGNTTNIRKYCKKYF